MAAVLAAILAGFLAGAVALFREHRQQQRRLLVAARVMHDTYGAAGEAIRVALDTDGWALFNAVPSEISFSNAWETYKADLAGHLTWHEWQPVEKAANHYLALRTMRQDQSPKHKDSQSVLEATRTSLECGKDSLYPYCTKRLSIWLLIRRGLRSARAKREPG